MRRRKMTRRTSRKSFRNGAQRVHGKNLRNRPMRGGYRI